MLILPPLHRLMAPSVLGQCRYVIVGGQTSCLPACLLAYLPACVLAVFPLPMGAIGLYPACRDFFAHLIIRVPSLATLHWGHFLVVFTFLLLEDSYAFSFILLLFLLFFFFFFAWFLRLLFLSLLCLVLVALLTLSSVSQQVAVSACFFPIQYNTCLVCPTLTGFFFFFLPLPLLEDLHQALTYNLLEKTSFFTSPP